MYQKLPDFNGQPAQAIKRIADGASIPMDPANTDYQAYLAWVAEGNVAEPAPVPTADETLAAERAGMVCSALQGRLALAAAGLLDATQAAVTAGDQTTHVAWEYATEWRRTSPMMATLAGAVGITETQMDDLFRAAMKIEV